MPPKLNPENMSQIIDIDKDSIISNIPQSFKQSIQAIQNYSAPISFFNIKDHVDAASASIEGSLRQLTQVFLPKEKTYAEKMIESIIQRAPEFRFPREPWTTSPSSSPDFSRTSDEPSSENTASHAIRSSYPSEDILYDQVTDETDVPHKYRCPITHTILRDPVKADDGHIYERFSIEEWLRRNNFTSPLTRQTISNNFSQALELKEEILNFLGSLPPTNQFPDTVVSTPKL